MTDEPLDEINSRDCFLYVFIIFMAIVMESNSMTVIVIDSGGCDNGTTQITTNKFNNCFRITEIWLGINVESMFMVAVTLGFDLFKGKTDDGFHFIQECSPESIAKKGVIKMFDMTPETIITETTFRDKAMNVWIPFEVSAECM